MSSPDRGSLPRLETPDQWSRWSHIMKLHFQNVEANGVWLMVQEWNPQNQRVKKNYLRMGYGVMAEMLKCLGRRYAGMVKNANSPKEMWERLERHIQGNTHYALDRVGSKLDSLRIRRGGDMERHVGTFRELIEEYKDLGGKLEDHELALKMLRSISSERAVKGLVSQIRRDAVKYHEGILDLEEVIEEIQQWANDYGAWKGKPYL